MALSGGEYEDSEERPLFGSEYDDYEERSVADYRSWSRKRTRSSQTSLRSQSQLSAHYSQPAGGQCEGVEGEDEEKGSSDDCGSMAETSRARSISMSLSDPDVLDCPSCYYPLTVPVFQCQNGHILCSTCCSKLGKCPSCSHMIGYSRCRAIEKVLMAVTVSCFYEEYGCREKLTYCHKLGHEAACRYRPCSCPFLDCSYIGSTRTLQRHVSLEHSDSVINFHYNSKFSVHVAPTNDLRVLQEEREGVLFILIVDNELALAVQCVERNDSKGRFTYDLTIRSGDSSLRFRSIAETTANRHQSEIPPDHLLVPAYFFDLNERLKLDICIWNGHASKSDVRLLDSDS